MTLRFFDTNPTVIIKGLEMFHQIFIRLADEEYSLLEQEASAFIPYAIVKVNTRRAAKHAALHLTIAYPGISHPWSALGVRVVHKVF